jgi:hypothetical protein
MSDRLKRLVDARGAPVVAACPAADAELRLRSGASIARAAGSRLDWGMEAGLNGCRRSANRGVNRTDGDEGGDCLIVLVNEEGRPQTGVELEGLSALEKRLNLPGGAEGVAAPEGVLITCLIRPDLKVSAGGRQWGSNNRIDRDYAGVVNQEPASTPAPEKKGSLQ